MTSGAERDEVFGVVSAAIGAWNDVVQMQESGVVAASAPATVAIASQNFAAGSGWDG